MLLPSMADATARRIHIVGGPGSGTRLLARRLGQLLAVPVYDLDAVAYEAGGETKRALDARRALVTAIAQQSGWVTQGVYLWWCEPLARHADSDRLAGRALARGGLPHHRLPQAGDSDA